MLASYDDIRSRIAEEPQWYDENGVPRYGAFTYEACPNIYADEVVLLEIACQNCGRRFMVEMHSDRFLGVSLTDQINDGAIHYGDPPRHGDDSYASGDTMNCEDIRIVEFWKRGGLGGDGFEWQRIPEMEKTI